MIKKAFLSFFSIFCLGLMLASTAFAAEPLDEDAMSGVPVEIDLYSPSPLPHKHGTTAELNQPAALDITLTGQGPKGQSAAGVVLKVNFNLGLFDYEVLPCESSNVVKQNPNDDNIGDHDSVTITYKDSSGKKIAIPEENTEKIASFEIPVGTINRGDRVTYRVMFKIKSISDPSISQTQAATLSANMLDLSYRIPGVSEVSSTTHHSVSLSLYSEGSEYFSGCESAEGGYHKWSIDEEQTQKPTCQTSMQNPAAIYYKCDSCGETCGLAIGDGDPAPHTFQRKNMTLSKTPQKCENPSCEAENPIYSEDEKGVSFDKEKMVKFELDSEKPFEFISGGATDGSGTKFKVGTTGHINFQFHNLMDYALSNVTLAIELPEQLKFESNIFSSDGDGSSRLCFATNSGTTARGIKAGQVTLERQLTISAAVLPGAHEGNGGHLNFTLGIKCVSVPDGTSAPIKIKAYANPTFDNYNKLTSADINETEFDFAIPYDQKNCQHLTTTKQHQDPTCQKQGYDRVICSDCGEIQSETPIPTVEHQYVNGKCRWCGIGENGELPPSHLQAQYKVTKTVEATCYAPGQIIKECTICASEKNKIHEDQVQYVPSLGHQKPLVQKEISRIDATCTSAAICDYEYSCARCGAVLAKETHVYTGHPLGHHFKNDVCDRCGISREEVSKPENAYHEHNFVEEVDSKEATCLECGSVTYKCNVQGCEETTTLVTAPTGHNWHDGVCTTCGLKETETAEHDPNNPSSPTNPDNPQNPSEDKGDQLDLSVAYDNEERKVGDKFTLKAHLTGTKAAKDFGGLHFIVESSKGLDLDTTAVPVISGSGKIDNFTSAPSVNKKGIDIYFPTYTSTNSLDFEVPVTILEHAHPEESVRFEAVPINTSVDSGRIADVTIKVSDGKEDSEQPVFEPMVAVDLSPAVVGDVAVGTTTELVADITNTVADSDASSLQINVSVPEGLTLERESTDQESFSMQNMPDTLNKPKFDFSASGATITLTPADADGNAVPFGCHYKLLIYVTANGKATGDAAVKVQTVPTPGEGATSESSFTLLAATNPDDPDNPTDPSNPDDPNNPDSPSEDNPSEPGLPSEVTDKSSLNDLIEYVKSLDSTKYTTETWLNVESALTQAEAVYANEAATDAQVRSTGAALRQAVLDLELKGAASTPYELTTTFSPTTATLTKNDSVTFTATVENVGTGDLDDPFELILTSSEDAVIIADSKVSAAPSTTDFEQIDSGTWSFTSLPVGQTVAIDYTVALDSDFSNPNGLTSTLSFYVESQGTQLTQPKEATIAVAATSGSGSNNNSSGNNSGTGSNNQGAGGSGTGTGTGTGTNTGTGTGTGTGATTTQTSTGSGNTTGTTSTTPTTTSTVQSKMPDTGMMPIAIICGVIAAIAVVGLVIRIVVSRRGGTEEEE